MLGTIVNAGAIILGCAVGLLLRRGIPERVTDAVMKGIGLCVIYIGISGALNGEKTIAMIIAMAAGGAQLDAGGPGLMFIYLVHVMNGMAGGRIVAMVFFVCVAFAGVTSIINLYEAPVASLQERFGLKRVPATAVIHVIASPLRCAFRPSCRSGWTSCPFTSARWARCSRRSCSSGSAAGSSWRSR